MKRFLIAIIVAFNCSFILDAQEVRFQSYGESDGLTDTHIECVVQDSLGYTWIGTTDGLYLYDGIYFDNFRYSPKDSLSLSSNHVTTLLVDKNKERLWVGTNFGGVNIMNLNTFKFERLQRPEDKDHPNGLRMINAIGQVDDWLLIGTGDYGLQAYNITNKVFVDLVIKDHLNGYDAHNIVTRNRHVYIGTNYGLYEYTVDKFKDGDYKLDKASFCNCSNIVRDISFLNDSILLVGFGDKLVRKNICSGEKRVIFTKDESESVLSCHQVDSKGDIWLGTRGDGLLHFNSDGQLMNRYKANGNDGALVNNWIGALHYSSAHDLLWVGTKDGLSKYARRDTRFTQYQTGNNNDSRADNLFFLFKDSNESYWWWTFNGLFRKRKGHKTEVFKSKDGSVFYNDTVSCGYEDANKTLWLGTFDGLLAVNLQTDAHKRIRFKDTSFKRSLNVIKDIKTYDGKLWLISYDGVIEFNPSSEEYQQYPYPDEYRHQGNLKVTTANFDKHGVLWIGDKGGFITSFNVETKEFKRISTALVSETGHKSYNRIMHLHTMDDSTVLIATYGTGLLKYNKVSGKVSRVEINELLSTNIYTVYEDNEGYLWMNTNSKILRYSIKDNQILSFGRRDGTMCREFNGKAHHQSVDGNILMGGIGGFVEFNPAEFCYNTELPNVDLSSYLFEENNEVIGGVIYNNWEVISSDTLELSTDHHPISFYTSVLNYQNSNKNMVAWQLEGYENTWDTMMASGSKTYMALPEGKYKLKVKGCNNDQFWNNNGDEITLIVKPDFLNSKLFKSIIVVLFFSLVYLIYMVRSRYLRGLRKKLENQVDERTKQLQTAYAELEGSREEVLLQKGELEKHRLFLEDLVKERTSDLESAKRKAEQADRLKTAFLANLSHEIRTPMNSIVGFATLLSNDVYTSEERKEFANVVQKSSDSLLVLINDIIDISRIETGQINFLYKDVNVNGLCKDVFKSLELNVKSFSVDYELDVKLENKELSIKTDPERLKQVLINLLNNALKFTSEGHVRLIVMEGAVADPNIIGNGTHVPKESVLFSIDDSGIGIAEKYHRQIFSPFHKVENGQDVHGGIGLGLSIVKQLVGMLGGKIWLKSKLGEGTTFNFYIPYKQKEQKKKRVSEN